MYIQYASKMFQISFSTIPFGLGKTGNKRNRNCACLKTPFCYISFCSKLFCVYTRAKLATSALTAAYTLAQVLSLAVFEKTTLHWTMLHAALNEHNRRASKFLLYVHTFVWARACASAPPFFEICVGVVLWYVRTHL